MEGLLTSWMKKDEIPQLTKLVRDTTISACDWATSKEGPPGPQILVLVARIIHECIKTGAADVLEEHLSSVLSIAWKIFQADFRASWRAKIFVLQRLKRIWRAINEGEVLDLLYDLAELLKIHEALDNLDDYTLFQPLSTWTANTILGSRQPFPDPEIPQGHGFCYYSTISASSYQNRPFLHPACYFRPSFSS